MKYPQSTIEKCSMQTQLLFDMFLDLKESKEDLLSKHRVSKGFDEHWSLERDSAVLSGNASNSTTARAHGFDSQVFRKDLEVKRLSLGTPPGGDSVKQCKSLEKVETVDTIKGSDDSEFVEFQQESRKRSYSHGPTEEQIRQVASVIADVGDKIERDYSGRLKTLERELTDFVKLAGNSLNYEMFAVHVNELIDEDRSWNNFMFVMHLSKRVIAATRFAGSVTAPYLRRFVGDAFAEEVASQTNVVNFVNSGVAANQ